MIQEVFSFLGGISHEDMKRQRLMYKEKYIILLPFPFSYKIVVIKQEEFYHLIQCIFQMQHHFEIQRCLIVSNDIVIVAIFRQPIDTFFVWQCESTHHPVFFWCDCLDLSCLLIIVNTFM